MKGYLSVFLAFLKLGCITFGGGYAMIPVVDRELIKKKGWVTMDEVMDYYTIAQITPGIIAVNLSTFVGYKQKGPLGGILATLGFIIPGVTLITALALFISNFADIPAVQHAFTGIRIAVGALILDTVIKMVKGVFKDIKAILIYAIAFALSAVWNASPMLIVLGAGLVGLAAYRPKKTEPPENTPAGKGDSR
ncbi:chromate transporter [Leadbettera azotonutricia]|uniref:Chromate transport protein n=1 Tax=Leadbettera azotonutricia (strain ATCC BAA-888 / DSM 13862 / ZAS-9) TaxID=545695 RepID=F5YA02_LEAAZ|nr:chromate transporter [Leadbettera azotonutricia]AEF82422.1 chromate transport protein [Leadbettera azotonutricia ZAS-9]